MPITFSGLIQYFTRLNSNDLHESGTAFRMDHSLCSYSSHSHPLVRFNHTVSLIEYNKCFLSCCKIAQNIFWPFKGLGDLAGVYFSIGTPAIMLPTSYTSTHIHCHAYGLHSQIIPTTEISFTLLATSNLRGILYALAEKPPPPINFLLYLLNLIFPCLKLR